MTENISIELEARLSALEHMACVTYSMVALMQGMSEDEITASEYRSALDTDQLASEIGALGTSDRDDGAFVSALQDAVASLQSHAREMREEMRSRSSS